MKLRNCDIRTFFSRVSDGTLYCYGIGDQFERMLQNFGDYPWKEKLGGLIDRSRTKQGPGKYVQGTKIRIIAPDEFLRNKKENAVLLITCTAYAEIIEYLNRVPELDGMECYIYDFLCNLPTGEPIVFKRGEPLRIPPVIHYCWFGKGPLPDLYKRCIDSWHKFCPEYKFVEWNEDNCDIDSNQYTKQAYQAGKYGFVPDYFRLKIIYENGGIYLDTDVELLKNLDDLRHEEAFCGLQHLGEAAFGLGFGAVKGHSVIGKLMEVYEDMGFLNEDGTHNLTASPFYQTRDLMTLGMKSGNRQQYVAGMCIYPTEVLCPIEYQTNMMKMTENTYAIHHFSGSWLSAEEREKLNGRLREKQRIMQMFQ